MRLTARRMYHHSAGIETRRDQPAPTLKGETIEFDCRDFIHAVANERDKATDCENSVMPAFGENPNVLRYLDDIHMQQWAHGSEAVPRGRLARKEAMSDVIRRDWNTCLDLWGQRFSERAPALGALLG